ncbi:acyl-CoA synthetase (AMP-forming)/AMP-acid ligase II [Leucobacter exalbidus]|uniref:Acyl-CoA synthetase (AMP-forming)/AMP-acid ligase II n=1 Tax=Leucobacter exalbidus TaxID=662960 RepID=A0A940PS83_9MICO|nr:AMP-binding protein [Leucobacter exalbidus]MBP1325828.1 acyl-CoA synthetase (AMP-forming)/AMP-acid ligase II [Leucobacter exalbidus]
MMRTIDNFDAGFATAPNRTFLLDAESGETLTYDEVSKFTHRFAHAIRTHGLGKESKIAVLSHNSTLMYQCVLGVLRSDAIWLPVNARSGVDEMVDVLTRFECDLLFYEGSASAVAESFASLPGNEANIVLLTKQTVTDWMGTQPDSAFQPAPDNLDTVYAIQATGGTTGVPKAVQFSNRNARSIVSSFMTVAPFHASAGAPHPVYLATAPLSHAAGQFMQLIMRQAGTAVIPHGATPADLLKLIEEYRVTHTFLPPTVIYGMLDEPELNAHDYGSLQYLVYGASPMSPVRLARAIKAFGPVLAQLYGQTETGVPNTWLSPQDHFINGDIAPPDRLSSAGRIVPGTQLVILDESGNSVPTGSTGEIAVRGEGVTPGYYKDEEATAAARHGQYFLTGDIAYIDESGFVHIVDRKKDVIITGGFNVYSAEVERRILAFPGIAECAVLGIPDPKWGESVTALIEPIPGNNIVIDELRAFCREALGPVKTPKTFIVRDSLPRSAVGKILKRELRQEFWSANERMVS